MIITITKQQKDFLVNIVLKDHPNLLELIKQNSSPYFDKYKILISDSLGSEVRDLCEETLIQIGFDENYNLNENGKMLEDLSDLIYENFDGK